MWILESIYNLLKNNKWTYVKKQTKTRAAEERTLEILS